MPDPITLTIAGATVATVAYWTFQTVKKVVDAPQRTIEAAGTEFQEIVRTVGAELRSLLKASPKITLNRQVIQYAPQEICELCLLKQQILVKEEFVDTKFRSTKRLSAEQVFTLKAGLDLNKVKFEFDAKNRSVKIKISEPMIVNICFAGDHKIREEHGLWNKISAADRERVINSLPHRAADEAEKLDLAARVEKQLETIFERLASRHGISCEVAMLDHSIEIEREERLEEVAPNTLQALGIEFRKADL